MAPETIIQILKEYSAAAESAYGYLQKYDYHKEARDWDKPEDPKLLEPTHPTLRYLYSSLARYIVTVNYAGLESLPVENRLSKNNIQSFTGYLEASEDRLLAERFCSFGIEAMKEVADQFDMLNLVAQARILRNVYSFCLGIRQWCTKSKYNPGTPIEIKLDLNYDEVTPQEQDADRPFSRFRSLFLNSCNYTDSQKRNMHKALSDLYNTLTPGNADKTVIGFLLLMRKKKSFKNVFTREAFVDCKRILFDSLGRNWVEANANTHSYSENSLESDPILGRAHVKRAENLIKTALEKHR